QGENPVLSTNFEPMLEQVALFDIRSSFSMQGSTIKVVADIMPFVDQNARVFVSVNEKKTVNNTGSNGETEFFHVMMKMLPDAQGTQVDFVVGEEQHFEFECDMASTHVEEMSDLEVAVWVQNHATKEIYNSRFAYEYTDEHPYSVQNLKAEEEEGVYCHCLLVSWDAPSQGTPTGYNVYVNNVLVAENVDETEYEFEYLPEKLYIIEVQAIYGEGKTSVKQIVMFQETQSVDETENQEGKVYPNPSNGQFNFDLGEGQWSVEVFDITGRKVYENLHEGHSAIDLGQCPKGMYFLKAKNESEELTAKIVLR
ncbi:MAG: T9SS type A sorting domain-containing protein, partial [Bacteroidales bacterium]|nr:T9SS type A sorting domain-containing protein [Bacteroidales bacterium]